MNKIFIIIYLCLWMIPLRSQPVELEKELIAYYPFNGNALDMSGYQNDGSVVGPVLTEDRYQNANSAYFFDGFDDYILVNDADILSFPDQHFSIALWMKPAIPKHAFLLYKGSSRSNREYAVGIRRDTLASIHINGGGSADLQYGTPSTTLINRSEWYHVVGTWDGSNLAIYINGKLENQENFAVEIGNFDSDLFIGLFPDGSGQYTFHGTIDDIFIYRRVINQCEIDALYSGQLTEER